MNNKLSRNFEKQAKGTVLMFTLAVLLLLSLMGAAILLSTRSGPKFSDTIKEREAFLRAGSAVNIAAVVTRVILNPEMGDPAEFLAKALPYQVTLNNFDLESLLNAAENRPEDRLGNQEPRLISQAGRNRLPQLFFWQGSELIATATISIERNDLIPAGMSLAETDYDFSGEATARLMLVVFVNGQSSLNDTNDTENSHSLITAIFREVI